MSNILTSNINSLSLVTINVTTPAVAANTVLTQTYTVPGIQLTDTVTPEPTTIVPNLLIVDAIATAANTVQVQYANPTATPVSAGTSAVPFQFLIYRTDATIGSVRS